MNGLRYGLIAAVLLARDKTKLQPYLQPKREPAPGNPKEETMEKQMQVWGHPKLQRKATQLRPED